MRVRIRRFQSQSSCPLNHAAHAGERTIRVRSLHGSSAPALAHVDTSHREQQRSPVPGLCFPWHRPMQALCFPSHQGLSMRGELHILPPLPSRGEEASTEGEAGSCPSALARRADPEVSRRNLHVRLVIMRVIILITTILLILILKK